MILGRAAKVCPCFCAKKTKEKLKNNLELKEIINGMIAETGRPMSAEDIYKSMTDNGGEIQIEEIKLALKELSRDGRVIITRRGKAALPEQLGLIYGRIQGNGRGFGFFIPADGSGDLFIAAEDMNGALHGDTVWVRKLTGSPRGRNDRGAVEMIARRAGGRVIGTFEADNERKSRTCKPNKPEFQPSNGWNYVIMGKQKQESGHYEPKAERCNAGIRKSL